MHTTSEGKEPLTQAGAKILGAVLNGQKSGRGRCYYYYYGKEGGQRSKKKRECPEE